MFCLKPHWFWYLKSQFVSLKAVRSLKKIKHIFCLNENESLLTAITETALKKLKILLSGIKHTVCNFVWLY